MQEPQLVGYGVDTLILNMRYTDEQYHPIKKELAEEIAFELDELQGLHVATRWRWSRCGHSWASRCLSSLMGLVGNGAGCSHHHCSRSLRVPSMISLRGYASCLSSCGLKHGQVMPSPKCMSSHVHLWGTHSPASL